ncbi:hypothetical protein BGZ70_006370, partial [Mortierella alpina]
MMQRHPNMDPADIQSRQTMFTVVSGDSSTFYTNLMAGLTRWSLMDLDIRAIAAAQANLSSAGGSTTAVTWTPQTCATFALDLYKQAFTGVGPAQPVHTGIAAGLSGFTQQAGQQLHTQMVTHWKRLTPELIKK